MNPRIPPADATTRFTSRVADYAAYRPRYPQSLYDFLNHKLGLSRGSVVADIGSGTGIFCEPLLELGCRVHAIEPNAAMRAESERMLSPRFADFHSVDGTAEATTLPDCSVDAVVAAQAFHWFEPTKARSECRRILRPGGPAVMVWNTRKTGGSAFLVAYEALLNEFGTDYAAVRHDRNEPARLARFFANGYRRVAFPNEQRLDLAGLRGRVLSSSYTPGPNDPRRADLLAAIDRLFTSYATGGAVTIEYETEAYYGTP